MNHELQLKVQAKIDGELSPKETREIESIINSSEEARGLHEELTWARAAVRGNEMPRPVPDTREFYWSQIQRAIDRQPAPEAVPAHPWSGWKRFFVPLTAV